MHHRPLAPLTARELLLLVVAQSVLIFLLWVLGGSVLWTRPFWLDELCCTVYLARDAASPAAVVAGVGMSRDYAPPLLHLMAWTVGRLTGGITPVVLRTLSLACVALALLFLYATLRRQCGRAAAAAGILAVATHSLVIAHAFEGRFYGPWLFFAAGYAWAVGRGSSRGGRLAQALFAVLLVSIHWFGVLSLGLMASAAFAAHGRNWRRGLRHIAPSSAGLVILMAFIPFVLVQLATTSGVLWVPPLSSAQVSRFLQLFFFSVVPLCGAALVAVAALRRDAASSVGRNAWSAARDPGFAALAALALMPLLLIIVSVVLQPSMLDRYGILTVLAWAPLVALGVTTLDRAWQSAMLVLLAVLVVQEIRRAIDDKRRFAASVRANAAALEQAKRSHLPIVFQSLLDVYPVAGPERSQLPRFLALPDSTIRAMVPQPRLHWLRNGLMVERNIALGHARTYGFPAIAAQAELDTTPRFFLIASSESLPRLYERLETFAAAVFPRHRLRRLSDRLALLERMEAARR